MSDHVRLYLVWIGLVLAPLPVAAVCWLIDLCAS